MDAEIETVALRLKQEPLQDLPFFGICGFAVGWLMRIQYRLTQNGMAPKDSLADALFSDFVSFNAFGLVLPRPADPRLSGHLPGGAEHSLARP